MTITASEPGIRFNKQRFVEAVFEVIRCCATDPDRLGKSRLHTSLYFADMSAYLDRGDPITGVEYVKEPFGPAARYLDWALDVLQTEGRITVERTVKFGMPLMSLRVTDTSRAGANILPDEDRRMVIFWAEWVCGFNQTDFGDLCKLQPWNSVRRFGDRIPYASAFLLLPERRAAAHDEPVRKAG